MQKSAQSKRELGRGIGSWLKDIPSSISGRAAEKYFNPEFKKVMTSLRKADNNIRSIVTGESIGTEDDESGNPGKYKISMKQLLKQIKSNLNRREYMVASADLGRFHAKLFEIANQIHSLDDRVSDLHNQFLFGTKESPILTEDQWEHLQDMRSRYAAAKRRDFFVKEAGLKDIADFFHNITNERGRALAIYEKRYGKRNEKMKKDAYALLKDGDALVTHIIATMKELASLRSTRNPDKYIEKAIQLSKRFEPFDAKFKEFYNTSVKGLLERADSIYATKKQPESESKEMGDKKLPVEGPSPATTAPASMPPVPELAVPGPKTPEQLPLPGLTPGGSPPFAPPANQTAPAPVAAPAPAPAEVEEPVPPTNPGGAPPVDESIKKPAHQDFYRSLQRVSKEHPNLLKSYIAKYARSIQDSDPEIAIKLFKIATQTKE